MNVKVKCVNSPFSFFCVEDEVINHDFKFTKEYVLENSNHTQFESENVHHGQYVAVLWKNKWVRGIVSSQSNFIIWLVDHGNFIQPTESTVFVNLPAEYKKLPSKVFEASIHGVIPVGLEPDESYIFRRKMKMTWSVSAVEKARELITKASSTFFMPVSLLTTKFNDVVLGDLYLQFEGTKGRYINLIDAMSCSADPVHKYMERNEAEYIKNLAALYTTRKQHRACLLKPEIFSKSVPTITTSTTLAEYNAICDKVEPLFTEDESDSSSVDGSTVTYIENIEEAPDSKLKLTPSEIQKYCNEYIIVGDREYNVLNVLISKARDLYMCEKYKDAKSIGRATTRLKY